MKKLMLQFSFIACFVLSLPLAAQIFQPPNSTFTWSKSLGLLKAIEIRRVDTLGKHTVLLAKYSNFTVDTSNASIKNVYINAGQPIEVIAGEELNFDIDKTIDNSYKLYIMGTYIIMDLNSNDVLESVDRMKIIGTHPGGRILENMRIPCPDSPGNTFYIRIASTVTPNRVTDTADLSVINYYIETKIVSAPKLRKEMFLEPYFYTHQDVYFDAQKLFRQVPGYTYLWLTESSGLVPVTQWWGYTRDSAGTYDIRVLATSCSSTDTLIKQYKVRSPKHKPSNEFRPGREHPWFYWTSFYNYSDSGAYKWEWDVVSPSGKSTRQLGPGISVNVEYGTWYICMRAYNEVGWSSWNCQQFQMNDFNVNWHDTSWLPSGNIYTEGGMQHYYDNNMGGYLAILPDAGPSILTMHFLRMADSGDAMFIYDGNDQKGRALHPPGGFTKGYWKGSPINFISNSGHWFIVFQTDSKGWDSSCRLSWRPIVENKLQGRVYFDLDSNCFFDEKLDIPVPKYNIRIGDRSFENFHRLGMYTYFTDTNSRKIELQLPVGWKVRCPDSAAHHWHFGDSGLMDFALMRDSIAFNDYSSTIENISSFPPQPFTIARGLKSTLSIKVSNEGNLMADSVACRLRADRRLLWMASGDQNIHNDSIIDLKIHDLNFMTSRHADVNFKVYNSDTGTVKFNCSCYPLASWKDDDSSNNSAELALRIVMSKDPNDKQVQQENNEQFQITGLNYMIRFQNKGLCPAYDVIIRDTLSTDLDTNTFQFTGSSHDCSIERAGYALAFKFLGIQLPDSNHNEPGSHGHIYYSIQPKPGLPEKKRIYNTAFIYFDVEDAVVTNTTASYWQLPVNSIKKIPSAPLNLYPVPAQDKLFFHIPVLFGIANVSVFAMDFRKILHADIVLSDRSNALDVSLLPNGIYIFRITQNGISYTEKFNIRR